MVQVDETTQGVLNQISEGFEQKGAYNLRQNRIPLSTCARMERPSATVTVNISKSAKKRISRALIF